jgi:hypothetical protein
VSELLWLSRNVIYGTPLGKVYPEIETELLDMQTPVEMVLDRVIHLVRPPRDPIIPDNNGNRVGFIAAATWAMTLFGANLVSLPLFMHSLMGLSASLFLWRLGETSSRPSPMPLDIRTSLGFDNSVWTARTPKAGEFLAALVPAANYTLFSAKTLDQCSGWELQRELLSRYRYHIARWFGRGSAGW